MPEPRSWDEIDVDRLLPLVDVRRMDRRFGVLLRLKEPDDTTARGDAKTSLTSPLFVGGGPR